MGRLVGFLVTFCVTHLGPLGFSVYNLVFLEPFSGLCILRTVGISHVCRPLLVRGRGFPWADCPLLPLPDVLCGAVLPRPGVLGGSAGNLRL